MGYKIKRILVGTQQVRPVPYQEIIDNFSGTSLDTSIWNTQYISSIGSITVNNGLTMSTPGTGGGNAGGPIISSKKLIDGTEKKITYECVFASGLRGGASIGGQEFWRVSEDSYYKCNGNLPILTFDNGSILYTKSSTSFSGSNNAFAFGNWTSGTLPVTVKVELDLTNKSIKCYEGGVLKINTTIESSVNLSDWIGKPVAAMTCLSWDSGSRSISSVKIKIEY